MTEQTTASGAVVEFISRARLAEFPSDAIAIAKRCIIDGLGVLLAGSTQDAGRILYEHVQGSDPRTDATVFGPKPFKTGAAAAALVNGTSGHALDWDDTQLATSADRIFGLLTHPTIPPLVAALAVGEPRRISGAQFLEAFLTGFEVECKIAEAIHPNHYKKGFHSSGTVGTFGAAVATGKLLGLNATQTAHMLAIAASSASGIRVSFGSMTKPLHVGHSSRNGLLAAQLAKGGFTAGPLAFEHKQGYLEVFNGKGNYDMEKMLPGWGKPWDIVEPGIAIKTYPCCGSTHPALDVMIALAREHDLQPDQVERIDSWTHARRLEHTNRPDPRTETDAKFSVQYCLARALADRKVVIGHFEGDAYQEVRIRNLLPRIHAAPYTTAQFPADNHFGAEVKVTLRDGRVISGKIDQPHGRTSANPLPAQLLKDKFVNCALRVLPEAQVAQAYAAIETFEQLKDIRDLTRLVAIPSRNAIRPAVAA